MKMKYLRKTERDRARREQARGRHRRPDTTGEPGTSDPSDTLDDDLDLDVARSLLGYDE